MRSIVITLRPWLMLTMLILVAGLFYYFNLQHYLTLAMLKSYHGKAVLWTSQHYQLSVAIYILIMTILIACAIPCATFFTLVGGFLFSVFAFIYAVIGITLGGIILFLAVRTAIGAKIAAKSSGWIKTMEAGFQRNAFHYLLMLRLIPIFPCGVSNIAAGALNVSLKTFTLATILGIAPATLIYVLVGRGLGRVLTSDFTNYASLLSSPSISIPLVGLALLSILPILYKSIKKSN